MDIEKKIIKLIRSILPKKMSGIEITPGLNLSTDLNIDSLKLVALAIEFSDLTGIDLTEIDVDPSSIVKVRDLVEIAEKYSTTR